MNIRLLEECNSLQREKGCASTVFIWIRATSHGRRRLKIGRVFCMTIKENKPYFALPSIIVAGHVIVGEDGATSRRHDGRRHHALVNPHQEQEDEY